MNKLEKLHSKAAYHTQQAEEGEKVWYQYREHFGYSPVFSARDILTKTPTGRRFNTDLTDSIVRAERRMVVQVRRHRSKADKLIQKIMKLSIPDIPTSDEQYAESENNG